MYYEREGGGLRYFWDILYSQKNLDNRTKLSGYSEQTKTSILILVRALSLSLDLQVLEINLKKKWNWNLRIKDFFFYNNG